MSLLLAYPLLQFATGLRADTTTAEAAPPFASLPAQVFPTPPTQITSALATVPPEFSGVEEQSNFDLNAWLTFVALNWPADAKTCGPDLSRTILNGQGARVWETYPADSDVFVQPPATPVPWCAQTPAMSAPHIASLPARLLAAARRQGVRKFLYRNAKASQEVSEQFPGIEEAVGGPLTDQSGRFARYEVRLNQDEYNFLTQNNLWSLAGQNAYTQTISFPAGPSAYGPTGPIEIKAAWKVLTAREIASKRFFMTKAVVYNDEKNPPTPSPGPNPVTLGLVGFHIAHKTKLQPTWIWSTFEHVDNLRPPPGSVFGAKASFSNPGCPPATCPPNVQTAASPYVELSQQGKPLNRPVQVVRLNPTADSNAARYNQAFQKLLAGSVWANYQLISSQWVGEVPARIPQPAFLANSVQETFVQAPSPPSDGPVPFPSPGYNPFAVGKASASCLKCHSVAQTRGGKTADFSFLLFQARGTPTPTPAPAQTSRR
jgi:hypothetical protein